MDTPNAQDGSGWRREGANGTQEAGGEGETAARGAAVGIPGSAPNRRVERVMEGSTRSEGSGIVSANVRAVVVDPERRH
jgi:hypothetical protein